MKIEKPDYEIYDIIHVGQFSVPEIGEGRFVPTVIIDSSIATDVVEIIELHKGSSQGDVEISWASPFTIFNPKGFTLTVRFMKPQEMIFGIYFDVAKHHSIIDGIILSQALKVQCGKPGQKILETMGNGILIEIPRTNFSKHWDNHILKLVKKSLKNSGVSKNNLNNAAKEHIRTNREIWHYRG